MRIGIDIMGGDYAPQKTVHGAILALNELPKDTTVVLFGKESQILAELKQHSFSADKFEIIDCTEVIDMGEHPTKAFKSKPNSSIAKGFQYLALGKIDGFASAGNTGAMFVGGFYSVKAIEGILRPAISTLIPRNDGGVTVLLDVGANADCKPDVLYQFGILGSLFSEHVCGIKKPNVSLLNLGEEKTKGNMLTQATYSMMENNADYHFACEDKTRRADWLQGRSVIAIAACQMEAKRSNPNAGLATTRYYLERRAETHLVWCAVRDGGNIVLHLSVHTRSELHTTGLLALSSTFIQLMTT